MATLNGNPITISNEEILSMGKKLKDCKVSMAERFRILFTLRNINTTLAVQIIGEVFTDPSVLLKHELAYCLGQMGHHDAIPVLSSVLENANEDPMVRHEAGEALGNIGGDASKEVLTKYVHDNHQEVAETCQLALDKITNSESTKFSIRKEPQIHTYSTNDPAYPIAGRERSDPQNISELRDILINPKETLYRRYEAMFTLRNIGNKQAIEALCEGLKDSSSALFRHEIAFVLGQLQSPHSTESLAENLANLEENEMVRHECAEALGAIGTDDARHILEKYLNDSKQVVKESVLVALDICDYEQCSDAFQYANGLNPVNP